MAELFKRAHVVSSSVSYHVADVDRSNRRAKTRQGRGAKNKREWRERKKADQARLED